MDEYIDNWEYRPGTGKYACTRCGGFAEEDETGNPILSEHCPHCNLKLAKRVTFDQQAKKFIETPPELAAYLDELMEVSKKHGLVITFSGDDPVLSVVKYDDRDACGIREAEKNYE